jgi:carbon-monoxide dehydrogenase medium subunit
LAIVTNFDYVKPKTLKAVFKAYSQYRNPLFLAGGTDLVDQLKGGIHKPDVIIDVKGLKPLNKLALKDDVLFIGAGVTFAELIASKMVNKKFPVIVELSKQVASVGIRNRATMVGNICSAVPCMDSGPLLVAYNAAIHTESKSGKRAIPAEEWFVSPRRTALQSGELVTGISIPLPQQKHGGCFVKLGRYTGEDLAQVNLVLFAFADGTFSISFGSVAPVPVRARKIEALLNGQTITAELLDKAKELVEQEIKPITDIRASKEYRMHMSKVMLERAVTASLSRMEGKGPAYGKTLI